MLTTRPFPSVSLFEEFDSIIRNIFSDTREQDSISSEALFETDDGWSYRADLPGFTKEDLSIDFEKNILTIKTISSETNRPDFERKLTLNEKTDATNITASLQNGELDIQIPKIHQEAQEPLTIKIV